MTLPRRHTIPFLSAFPARLHWHALLPLLFGLLFFLLTPAAGHAETAAPASSQQLADLLEDPASREALIQQLRKQTAASESAPLTTDGTADFSADLARFLGSLGQELNTAVDTFRSLGSGEGMSDVSAEIWRSVLTNFAIVAAITLLAWAVLRWLAGFYYARVDRRLADGPAGNDPHRPLRYRNATAIGATLLLDLAVVALATLAGYIASLWLVGQPASIGMLEDVFLKTFLATEAVKTLVRMVFATRYPHLRLVDMPDDEATFWNNWLERLISVSSYSLLIAVPLIKAIFSPAVGQMLGLVIMLGVYIYALRVVWRNRKLLRERLLLRAQHASAFFGTLLRMLARIWHLLAIAYFTVLLGASQLAPDRALPFMVQATLQSLLAIAIALVLSAVLTRVAARRIELPGAWRNRLPLLERRLNAYVPAALKGLRLLLLVLATLVVLDAWQVFDLSASLASDRGRAAIFMLVRIGIVLLIAVGSWTLVASVIEHRLSLNGTSPGQPSARERTLLTLFRNAAMVVIVTMTVLVLLAQIGIDIGPLIAGAGVVGLAIGFGAQKLVQDIITGVFIQLENGMNQNDVVEVAGVFGTVEKLTIRSVGIRTLDGAYHLVPFSSVDTVVNHMRDFSYHVGEYTIAHRENVDDAVVHLKAAFAELQQDEVLAPELLDDITVAGVTSLSERGVTIRILIKTTPGMQWAVQRGYNRLVKKHFDAARIELPYPHRVLYFGQDKNGNAPAMRMQQAEAGPPVVPGRADAPGQTPGRLARASRQASTDVLGNELEPANSLDEEPPKPA